MSRSKAQSKKLEGRKREILEYLHAGKEPPDIMDALGLSAAEFDESLDALLEDRSAHMRDQPTEHAYAMFAIEMTAIMRQLRATTDRQDKEGNYITSPRDAVAALKAQADIRCKILSEGRQLGIIRDKTLGDGTVRFALIAQLTNEQIRAKIGQTVLEFQALESGLVDTEFLDSNTEPMFSGDSAFENGASNETESK